MGRAARLRESDGGVVAGKDGSGMGESGMARGREGMCNSVNSAMRGGGISRLRGHSQCDGGNGLGGCRFEFPWGQWMDFGKSRVTRGRA